MASAPTTHENRLAGETSPYLLQHKHNPVDWWPWSPEALAEAERSGRPILLSVGYAACHWCHVMAHESFEDPATAAVMNALFVNIKVDREERPDIDQIYMAALHHLGEQGGWPLTMFLTPKGEPVWGGTYFPKESRYGRPAFVDVLQEVARLFREDRHVIDNNRNGADGAAGGARKAGGKSDARHARTGCRCAPTRRRHRPGQRRTARRAEISAGLAVRVALARRDCAAATRVSSISSTSRWSVSVKAASTIISAAASRAIRSTTNGWCRISRRCSTTMRSCWSCWRWPGSAAAIRSIAGGRARPWPGCNAK